MALEYFAIDLPGKILYPEEFNVKVRKITAIEQKYLMSLGKKQQKTTKEYFDFVKKLLEFDNPKYTFEDLFAYDVRYLLYQIRFLTYPKFPIKVYFTCGNILDDSDPEKIKYCQKEIIYDITPDKQVIPTPDDIPGFSDVITLENLGDVKIRNKIMRDDISIDSFIRNNKLDPNDADLKLLLLDLCLISNGKPLSEMYRLTEEGTITANDIVNVEEWFSTNVWGIKEEVTIKCPECGKEESREYYLSLEDFFSIL